MGQLKSAFWVNVMLKKYKEMDFDSEESAKIAFSSLHSKKCLRDNYIDLYSEMLKKASQYLQRGGVELELGSGGGFFKELHPSVITSDVNSVNGVDQVIDARRLPFFAESLSVIYATHVLHHIPNISMFFDEVMRCVKPGGGCVFVEPYWSPVGKLFYKRLHPEPYNDHAQGWEFSESGPMSGANQALSYILLKRDRVLFQEKWPGLRLVYDRPFNGLRYIATGGLWLKPFLPGFAFPILKGIEKALWPSMYLFGIHHLFVFRKE